MIHSCDVLVIECITWSPHLETAGEISLNEKRKGKNVAFCFLKIDNPDEYWSWKQNVLLASRFRKVSALEKILAQSGIEIIDFSIFNVDNISPKKNSYSNSNIRFFEYKNANLGKGIYSSIISKYATINPYIFKNIDKMISRFVKSSMMTYDISVNLIRKYNPKKVVVFNGRFALNNAICEAAKFLNVPVWYHERGANVSKYYYSDTPVHDMRKRGEMISVYWNNGGDDKVEVATSFFEKRKSGDGIGWYSFVKNQKKNVFPSKSKRRYTFFSSSEDEYEALGHYFNHSLFSSQREAVVYLINYFKNRNDTELVIRVHPHLAMRSSRDAKWWNCLHGSNVVIVKSDSDVDSYALLDSTEVVLSYNSTIGVEAIYWKKPSILLGDSPLSGVECFYEPKNINELESLLTKTYLNCADQKCVYPYGFYYMTFGKSYKYYAPLTLGSGLFLGQKLDIYPKLISKLVNIKYEK